MRRGFTLLEVSVAAAVGVVVLGGLTYSWVGVRQGQAFSGRYLDLLEGAVLAMHQLRLDLRQLSFVPGKPVQGYSLRISPDQRAIRLRRSAPPAPGIPAGSSFVVVEYRLKARGSPGRFQIIRSEWMASGAKLPGRDQLREEQPLRSATLRDLAVAYKEDEPASARMLHVAMDVTSADGVLGESGAGGAPSLVVTNVLQVQRPERPFGGELPLFAEPLPPSVQGNAETPPGAVLSPSATDADELPEF